MSRYPQTVDAAVTETHTKFVLAEALATEIPPRRPGPGEDDAITTYLTEARQAIIDAGGEPRAVKTLGDYRLTALWVSTGVGRNFGWVDGFSFSAHNEARAAGIDYADFAADPRTTDRSRRETGKNGTDGPATAVAAGWTPEEKREVGRALLDDPDVGDDVRDEAVKQATAPVSEAGERAKERERQRENDRPAMRWADLDGELAATRRSLARWASRLKDVDFDAEEVRLLRDGVAGVRTALDLLDMALGGSVDVDWDAEVTKLTKG